MFKKSSSADDIANTLNFLLNKKAVAQVNNLNKYEDLIKSLSSCAEKADSLDLPDVSIRLSKIVEYLGDLSATPDLNSADYFEKNHDYDGDNYLDHLEVKDEASLEGDNLTKINSNQAERNLKDNGSMFPVKAYKK